MTFWFLRHFLTSERNANGDWPWTWKTASMRKKWPTGGLEDTIKQINRRTDKNKPKKPDWRTHGLTLRYKEKGTKLKKRQKKEREENIENMRLGSGRNKT
jgi:hypothetical protein